MCGQIYIYVFYWILLNYRLRLKINYELTSNTTYVYPKLSFKKIERYFFI